MARDSALRWLLDNDPDATSSPSTLAYLRKIGCGNPVGQPLSETSSPDYYLEYRDHCARCSKVRRDEIHRVA